MNTMQSPEGEKTGSQNYWCPDSRHYTVLEQDHRWQETPTVSEEKRGQCQGLSLPKNKVRSFQHRSDFAFIVDSQAWTRSLTKYI